MNNNEHWKWIIWLTILTLLNAVALSAGRSERRGGGDRSSSESKSESPRMQQPSPPAVTQQQSAEARESRSVSRSASRPQRTEAAPSVSRGDTPKVEVRSRSESSRSNRVVSSENGPRTVERSRPVRHEVVVAPSSQSLDVSSSPAAAKASSPRVAQRASVPKESVTTTISSSAVRVQPRRTPTVSVGSIPQNTTQDPARRNREVEITGGQSERHDNSALTTIRLPRKGRTTETAGITEKANVSKESVTTTITSRAADTQTKEITPISAGSSERRLTQRQIGGSKAVRDITVRSGKRGDSASPTIRPNPQERSVEPIRVKTDDIKIQPRRSRPSDGQPSDNSRQVIDLRSKERDNAIPVLAAKTADTERLHKTSESDMSRRQSDSRWAGLRSKISARADFDAAVSREGLRLREDRRQREGLAGQDEQRGRVMVGRDNHIIMERGHSDERPRPHISNHLISDIQHVRNDSRWVSCGSSFVFRWSDSSCGRVILSPYHHQYGISYYYPSYHRKYLFVSLGGYWPYNYRYQRYYWYGCHPYYWYGADVVSQPASIVYDYTTYNYYNSEPAVAAEAAVTTGLSEDSIAADTPLPQTDADIRFANAVDTFEAGRYEEAVGLFREAIRLSPEDEVLPFTYCQALFASGDYAMAANVLREIMAKMSTEEPAIYYPRGLYVDDQVLVNQVAGLERAIAGEPFSADYQLLLGYHYLGVGQWDNAVNSLEQAANNPANVNAVTKLLDIAEKMEKDVQQTVTAPQS
jgi:tetratricopeptide (TPR) repeat protein